MPYAADERPRPYVITANLAEGGSQPYPPDGGVEPMQVGEVAREDAPVEAAIGRWKQVIGDGLRSRIDERRVTEVNAAVDILNRVRALGRPNYVRIV
jgi:hypothetical protein